MNAAVGYVEMHKSARSGRSLRVAKALTVFFALVCLAFSAQAASFDCAKASTEVEKLICGDAELSRLDEEMIKAYEAALPKAPNADVVKRQQIDWLQERNGCADRSCLYDQYQLRIGELERIIALVPLADTEESHYFEKESEKLKVIRDVVRRQKFVWYNPYMQESDFCTELKIDFIAGKYLEAVEPDFRTDDPHDPRFNELNECTQYYRQGAEEPEHGAFWGVEYWGGPPYRYYSVELDGNPVNGKEIVLYHEPTLELGTNGTSYDWIDPQSCVQSVGAGTDTDWTNNRAPRLLYRLSTLVKYKGEVMMVGITPSVEADEKTASYDFQIRRFNNIIKPRACYFDYLDIRN